MTKKIKYQITRSSFSGDVVYAETYDKELVPEIIKQLQEYYNVKYPIDFHVNEIWDCSSDGNLKPKESSISWIRRVRTFGKSAVLRQKHLAMH